MKIHLAALPQVRLGTDTTHLCAYSGKVMKFIKMMSPHHEIIVYSPESDWVTGGKVTMVNCLSDEQRIKTFGPDDANRLPAWPTDEQSLVFNLHAAAEILERSDAKDLVLLMAGLTHKRIKEFVSGRTCAEPFVGYEGIMTDKCAFESYAHMHTVYANQGIKDIRWYDRVIPPFVDPDEFPEGDISARPRDYLLFVGRLINRKGLHIANQIAKAAQMRLVVAGAGGQVNVVNGKWFVNGQDTHAELEQSADYVGPVGIEKRAELMSNALAVLCPTTYVEPGANVAIEAQMAGTPVIAPDCGVFSETIRHGSTGWHFRTLKGAIEGLEWAKTIDPLVIRGFARGQYSLEAIAPKFNQWFDDLQNLWGKGWDTL